ncbi:hypothetical protein KIN20_034440 [Parelaphostrongylus tenuis]|uniref:Uncharacterized protein n=1 Tax=Parelaphostrongylus tenuis TaxID=148309 RepID=A0AAD5R9P7_PARTN|nr:hypothetical protein KIN20_034440 [Parelaphostrongylus tenuis]
MVRSSYSLQERQHSKRRDEAFGADYCLNAFNSIHSTSFVKSQKIHEQIEVGGSLITEMSVTGKSSSNWEFNRRRRANEPLGPLKEPANQLTNPQLHSLSIQ